MQMLTAASALDWSGWVRGFVGAIVSGGAGAVSSGSGGVILDPDKFNVTQGGLGHLLLLMGICFTFSGVISLAKFLQLHPVPDILQAKLTTAAAAIAVAADSVSDAQSSADQRRTP
jgi:hypothetical protein